MSAMSKRRQNRQNQRPQSRSQQGGGRPQWRDQLRTGIGNAGLVQMLTGQQVSEQEADAALAGTETQTPTQSTPAPKTTTQPEGTASTRPSGLLGEVYDQHQIDTQRTGSLDPKYQWSLDFFTRNYKANEGRYAAVAAKTGVPAKLIAAIHFREASMNFNTYLHQGDPLGRPAVNHPADIPVFHVWEDAAVHALNGKSSIAESLNMDETTTDPVAIATYAERYNGLGYHYKDKPSPYVYAGTEVYEGGKYVRDGVYDPNVWDQQPGVLALIQSLDEEKAVPNS